MNESSTFADLVSLFVSYISLLVPVVIAITFLYVSWKVLLAWVIKSGDQASIDEGKNVALVGIVVLTFMFAFWGLLSVVKSSLGF